MNFESWDDLYNWNRCLMEDDWNDGQQVVVKDKRKAGECEFATTAKIAEPSKLDGKYKIVLEEKLKHKISELGGNEMETKIKNNGQVSFEIKNNSL